MAMMDMSPIRARWARLNLDSQDMVVSLCGVSGGVGRVRAAAPEPGRAGRGVGASGKRLRAPHTFSHGHGGKPHSQGPFLAACVLRPQYAGHGRHSTLGRTRPDSYAMTTS
ncbi:hypothetical protein SALBM135S_00315 [Streptomyces alboniger]